MCTAITTPEAEPFMARPKATLISGGDRNAIQGLPAPPDSFRAFIIPSDSNQTVAGCWYEKPYGWIEIQKSTANSSVSDGNGNYSLKGAQYGIYQGSNLVETLTTDENGYAKSGDLEVGSYTIKELSPSPGYALDTNAYDVTVSSNETAKAEVKEIPQNNPSPWCFRSWMQT